MEGWIDLGEFLNENVKTDDISLSISPDELKIMSAQINYIEQVMTRNEMTFIIDFVSIIQPRANLYR